MTFICAHFVNVLDPMLKHYLTDKSEFLLIFNFPGEAKCDDALLGNVWTVVPHNSMT